MECCKSLVHFGGVEGSPPYSCRARSRDTPQKGHPDCHSTHTHTWAKFSMYKQPCVCLCLQTTLTVLTSALPQAHTVTSDIGITAATLSTSHLLQRVTPLSGTIFCGGLVTPHRVGGHRQLPPTVLHQMSHTNFGYRKNTITVTKMPIEKRKKSSN